MSDHAFLAVALADDERHALAAALTSASPGPPVPGRRQSPQNWHITLRFVGECADIEADRLIHEVASAVDVHPGRVAADSLGAFPRESRAGVLYVGIDDSAGLLAYLAGVCETAARDVGFEPEERPFVPHITLARLRPAVDVRRLVEAFGDFRVPIHVPSITLFRTRRTKGAIHYEPIDTVEL